MGLRIPVLVEDLDFQAGHRQSGFGDVFKLLVLAHLLLSELGALARQRAQRVGFGHAPALNHFYVEGVPIPAHHRHRWR